MPHWVRFTGAINFPPPRVRRGSSILYDNRIISVVETELEAAVYLGISPGKFDQLVDDGRMPAPRRIDRRKVWDRYEIDMAFDALPSENPLSQASTWDAFRSP